MTEYKKWWAGEIKEVHGRRTVRENFEVLFDGEEESGVAEVRLDVASYGKSSNWVLLPQVEDDDEGGDSQASQTSVVGAPGPLSSQEWNALSTQERQNANTQA
eukprot:SAG11_NODE_4743_length_1783_cov_9.289786_1_plen_103_part_00